MTQRRNTGVATVILAVWLLLQTSTLYFQHHHPESASCEQNASCCLVAASSDSGTEPFSPIHWIGPNQYRLPGFPGKTAGCVICFFNQNYYGFTSHYVVPDGSQVPTIDSGVVGKAFFLPDDLLTITSPRAPPASCL